LYHPNEFDSDPIRMLCVTPVFLCCRWPGCKQFLTWWGLPCTKWFYTSRCRGLQKLHIQFGSPNCSIPCATCCTTFWSRRRSRCARCVPRFWLSRCAWFWCCCRPWVRTGSHSTCWPDWTCSWGRWTSRFRTGAERTSLRAICGWTAPGCAVPAAPGLQWSVERESDCACDLQPCRLSLRVGRAPWGSWTLSVARVRANPAWSRGGWGFRAGWVRPRARGWVWSSCRAHSTCSSGCPSPTWTTSSTRRKQTRSGRCSLLLPPRLWNAIHLTTLSLCSSVYTASDWRQRRKVWNSNCCLPSHSVDLDTDSDWS